LISTPPSILLISPTFNKGVRNSNPFLQVKARRLLQVFHALGKPAQPQKTSKKPRKHFLLRYLANAQRKST
jgi:hypothetical protein